jgi:hypothetical protein
VTVTNKHCDRPQSSPSLVNRNKRARPRRTAEIDSAFSMEALPSSFAIPPVPACRGSEAEGSAVCPSDFSNSKERCHPDRSEAKWRDLLCALRISQILRFSQSSPSLVNRKKRARPVRTAEIDNAFAMAPLGLLKSQGSHGRPP